MADQWGVEVGGQLANRILPALEAGAELSGHDASTAGFIAEVRRRLPAP